MKARFFRSLAGWVGAGLLWGLATGLMAQERTPWQEPSEAPFDFDAGRQWRGSIPAPTEVLGYAVGEAYADYGAFRRLLERYRGSERMIVEETGLTPERRPMHVLVISAPENLARIEAIKAVNQRLVDGRRPLDGAELDRLLKDQPIIVWLGYNIHGDEAAGTEAAMQVLHTLLDDDSPEVRDWLRQVVVVMNPCQNPDGRERFVVWANAHGLGRPETFAYEKENPWNVQGRYNHHYFDLNRDMIALSQPESRHTAAAYLEWMPQVAADHHGETKEYFFPPAALPINPNLPREQTDHWQDVFGRGNAAAFDAQHWMYYVRDYFDVFYPGYWDSWPSLQGATGMTYETSGGGKAGFQLRRDDGTIMTLRQAIAKHTVASLATIRTAAAHREDRLRDFHAFFVSAVAAGRTGELQQVFLADTPAAFELGALLRRHGIELQRLNQAVTLPAAQDFTGREVGSVTVPAGSLVVDLAQPRGRLARALFESSPAMDEAFVERQLAKVERNRARGENVPEDDYEFYDLTAWSLPLLMDVPAWRTTGRVPVDAAVTEFAGPGPGFASIPMPSVAWVIPADAPGAPAAAVRLLNRGYRVAVSTRPLEADGRTFPRGSFIVRLERNPPEARELSFLSLVGSAAVGVSSGFTAEANTGVGSESVISLRVPKVAVAVDEPVNPSSYGSLSFWLEQRLGVDFVPVAAQRLGSLDLRAFNVVLLPAGAASGWAEIWSEAERRRLKRWVEEGGTLICLGGAAEFAAASETEWTDATVVGREGADGEEVPFADRPLPIPGALLWARADLEHFLGFGARAAEMPYLVEGDVFFHASTTGTNVVTLAEDDLWIAGHIWPDNTARLAAGTAVVIDEPVGEGHIILFADEPGHRALWLGSTRLLGNAILYAPGLRNDVGSYVR